MSAADRLAPVLASIERLGTEDARRIHSEISAALESPAAGTMRAWMESHDSQSVDTVQVSSSGPWCPLDRRIDALKPSAARFVNDLGVSSSREYAGCRVAHATENVLIVLTSESGFSAVVAYVIRGAK